MRRLLLSLLILTLAPSLPGFAQAIRSIDETVVLRDDGSARITQVWDVTVVSGTEFYLPFDHLGPMDITDLSVIENGVAFISEGNDWDTDRTREEKRGRCGIVRKTGGVELCWGQGDYGDHLWTVSYTVTGLVMRMKDDYNGLYFTFVNPGLSAPPQHVRVSIINQCEAGAPWTADNVKVWGFRSDSEIFVEDGAIRAESLSPFGSNSAMTVLVRFDPDLFKPSVSYSKSFEEIRNMAFEGSDYETRMTFGEWVVFILSSAFLLVVFLLSPTGIMLVAILFWLFMWISSKLGFKYRKRMFGQYRITDWYRDIPLDGNIPAAYFALTKGDRMDGMGGKDVSRNLISAYFLRWVMQGIVQVLPAESGKNRVNLSFEKEHTFPERVENDLYLMVREASGANLILEAGEFEKWSKKSFKKLSNLPERAVTLGRKWFEDRHYLVSGIQCTPEGQEQARHLIEFKNYLNDFTLHQERGAVEVSLWQDLLVFAALFGIADKVAKEFQKLYPAQFTEFAQTCGMNTASLYDMMRVSNNISASAMRIASAEKARRSSSGSGGRIGGGGGHFSSGGGGGSFGGSFGGGSR